MMSNSGLPMHRICTHTPLALALAAALGLAATAASAATIAVTSSADPGDTNTCTLRQAIASMNGSTLQGTCVNSGSAFGTGDRIVFGATAFPENGSNNITLSNGQLVITSAHLSIDATANGGVTIDADHASRVINAAAGSTGSLRLNHLHLINGDAAGTCYGFIAGGAICDLHTKLTLIASTVSDSSAHQMGGGIFSYSSALTVINSTISGNSTDPNGGNGLGGGIFSDSPDASNSVTLINSTVSGNTARMLGGGIFVGRRNGTLINSTISGNSAGTSGGGIYARDGITINDSIVAGNTGGDVDGPVTGKDNLIGGEPRLGALTDNGGPTPTMLPQPGSLAIDAIACDSASAADQRGVLRPQGFACDIGAVEAVTVGALVAAQGSGQSQTVWQNFFNPLVVQVLGPANRPAPYVLVHATPSAPGQPGAWCSDAITNGSGHAYLYCRANGLAGSYHVTVHAVDAPAVTPAVFALSNEPGNGDTIFMDGFDPPGPLLVVMADVGSESFVIDLNPDLPVGTPVPVKVITDRHHEPLLRVDALRRNNEVLVRLTRCSDHGRCSEPGAWFKTVAPPELHVSHTPHGVRAWFPQFMPPGE